MHNTFFRAGLFFVLTGLGEWSWAAGPIVINEIHYNPDVKTERVEFVELYNNGTNAVSLAGWSLADGVSFTFPAGTVLARGGYCVVAENPAAILSKFGSAGALGPWTGNLSSYGEKLTLREPDGHVHAEVNYGAAFPWPVVGDPPGYSIELIHPSLENDLGGSWRLSDSGATGSGATKVLIESNSVWKYFKGLTEASSPSTAWRQPGFSDAGWLSGAAPVGYGAAGDPTMNTPLPDMNGGYLSVFFRKTFVVEDPLPITSLLLEALYDDGIKVWINGSNVLNDNIATTEVPYDGMALTARENNGYALFTLNNPAAFLVPGTNVIAIQAQNILLSGSSDFFLDVRLRSQTGASGRGPTPGRLNSVYTTNAPPQIRQVEHQPEQPQTGQPVRITAKVTDPDGVATVRLEYQVVLPGQYIELTDAAYTNATNWISMPMTDDGTGGDLNAGDDLYSAQIPATVQVHRRLVRYRITVTDRLGASVRVPYSGDPQPNFAYFVYDGVPAWQGAIQPGGPGTNGVVTTVGSNAMNRLAVYHLLGKSNTVATATWFSQYSGDLYQWLGTLVYDGKVYDHIHYRARGGVWRYSMIKNMWKFDLNRGHDFEARDNWGRKFKTGWTKLNLGSCIQQGNFWHRGEQGMFESLSFRLFEKAGVVAPQSAFVQLRVIDDPQETLAASQYEGDFWGLYLALEQENGRLLEAHDLPDSNFYKMESGTGTLNNLGPYGPSDKSDLNYILNNYTGATEAWWRTNWNLPRFYSYQAIVQAVHHFDISDGKNYFYYFDPRTRLWEVMPWDTDLTWAHNMYRSDAAGSGVDAIATRLFNPIKEAGTGAQSGTGVMRLNGQYPAVDTEFRNRVREIRDLLFNTNQAYQMIEEQAALLRGDASAPGLLEADRCQWDYNPKMIDSRYGPISNDKAGQGRYYQFPLESGTNASLKGSFAATVLLLKNYVNIRGSYLDTLAADTAIPNRPSVSYVGPTNYPINRVTLRCSAFSSPAGGTFAGQRWRVAEVTDTNASFYQAGDPLQYEIEADWQATNSTFVADVTVPATVLKTGHRYRARAQMVDNTKRTSNWSLPVEFTVGEPESAADLIASLRITEVMYNPPTGGFEFIEFHNASSSVTLDLTGVKLTEGVDYTFPAGATLAPGAYLLVTKAPADNNFLTFRLYYALDVSVPVYGPFGGSLNNAGERLTLRTAAGGTDIVSFAYSDGRGWPLAATGAGHSLVLVETAEQGENGGAAEYGGNWRASAYVKGSPGRGETALAPVLVLNEIVAHTDYSDPLHPEYDSNDWIELYNPSDEPLTLGPGWFLSDDGANLGKYALPSNTVVAAHGFVTFDEVTDFHNPTNTGFGLNKDGEQVFLSHLVGTAQDRVVDAVAFKAQENGVALGRYPDGGPNWYSLTPLTRGTSNPPPGLRVVLNEIMYRPPDVGGTNDNDLDEFIELYNPLATPVAFFNTNGVWRINGEVSLDFPTNLTLGPGQYLLLVNFNPATNALALAAFQSRYGLTNPLPTLLGPYSGKLANSSARLALEKPQAADVAGNPPAWVIIDEVAYADQFPWPCGADGTGNSVQRVDARLQGSDPFNWSASTPTPGRARPNEPAGVATILSQPQGRTAAEGSDVTLGVTVCGTPPFTYQWRCYETNLPGATNATLTLRSLRLTQTGPYGVEVANAAGAVVSEPAWLVVQIPPTITAQPQSRTVVAYTSTTFEVQAGGTPPFQYQWRRNGTALPGATNQSLLLTNIQAAQAGAYTVLVFNSAGSLASSNAVLTVLMPAVITRQPQSTNLLIGTNCTLTVAATGTGTLRYQWKMNGTNLPGATASSLALTNVQFEHSGLYTVTVTDDIGTAYSDPAVVKVLMRPTLVEQPRGLIRSVGETALISFSAVGTEPMACRWLKNSAPYLAFEIATPTLVITNVQLSDAALYKAAITNEAFKSPGTVTSNAMLMVVMPPVSQTVAPGETATLQTVVAGVNPIRYAWYYNGALLFSGSNTGTAYLTATNKLVLTNAQPAQSGLYTFWVTNFTTVNLTNWAWIAAPFAATLTVGQADADTDGDGLPDSWETAYGLNPHDPTDAGADPDHDGLTNLAEYLAGTDPQDPESVLKLAAQWQTDGLVVQFNAVSNRTYQLQTGAQVSLLWSNLLTIPASATNHPVSVTNPISPGGAQKFFRVVIP